MTAIRRTALTLALTLAAILGSAGSTAPAQASFSDSASRTTSITTATVTAPGNVVGSLACGRSSATMGDDLEPQCHAPDLRLHGDRLLQRRLRPGRRARAHRDQLELLDRRRTT